MTALTATASLAGTGSISAAATRKATATATVAATLGVTAGGIHAVTADATLASVLTVSADGTVAPHHIINGTAQGCRFDDGFGDVFGPSTVSMVIPNPTVDSAPGPLTVTVSGASPAAVLTFTIGVNTVWTDVADAYGNLAAATIDLPLDMMAGTYTLTVTTTGNGSDSQSFTLTYDPDALPDTLPSDTAPVPVDAPNRWVFQDLMPGGLGSWTLPINPTTMTNPHYEKNVTTTHATSASRGQFTVGEGAFAGRPWRITGYCPDQDFYNHLMSFCSIRRRFYVQDHRGRIWLVGVQAVTGTPRQRQSDAVSVDNDWASNYDLTFVLYSQYPVTP